MNYDWNTEAEWMGGSYATYENLVDKVKEYLEDE